MPSEGVVFGTYAKAVTEGRTSGPERINVGDDRVHKEMRASIVCRRARGVDRSLGQGFVFSKPTTGTNSLAKLCSPELDEGTIAQRSRFLPFPLETTITTL